MFMASKARRPAIYKLCRHISTSVEGWLVCEGDESELFTATFTKFQSLNQAREFGVIDLITSCGRRNVSQRNHVSWLASTAVAVEGVGALPEGHIGNTSWKEDSILIVGKATRTFLSSSYSFATVVIALTYSLCCRNALKRFSTSPNSTG